MAVSSDIQQYTVVVSARRLPTDSDTLPICQSCRLFRVVLFNSATAVPQSFYAECARFLAGQGFEAYTYDYRGIAQSAPASLKGFDASVQTWAKQDIAGMIDFIRDLMPDEFGFKRLGHLGFFKRGRESLWKNTLGWIRDSHQSSKDSSCDQYY